MDFGLFSIIGIIIGGLIIGLIGKLLVRGRQDIPLWLTIVAGIVGVLVGSLIAGALGFETAGIWNIVELILQIVVGALAVAAAAAIWPRVRGGART
ncbi:MAG: GlsB/YeaQ/YmgE family stress response membrane protein [Pseudonocardia sp.]|nr:GlsB/YeaQ/YmgE family stress response membrane protein [Pseudonocardia sp.]